MWPTPAASSPNDGEDPDQWEDRRQRTRERLKNGNGMGTPLAIAARMMEEAIERWPTPAAADSKRQGNYKRGNPTLTEAAKSMWPTPAMTDGKNDRDYPNNRERNSPPLMAVASSVMSGTAWPTPKKTDALHTTISPSELERDGLSLATASYLYMEMDSQERWPTTQAFDARDFQRTNPDAPKGGGEKNLREIAVRWSRITSSPSSPPDPPPSPSGGPSSESGATSPPQWPTPTRRDERLGWLDRETVTTQKGPRLSDVAAVLTESQLLNPRFVEWLHGLPTGWTDPCAPIDGRAFALWATRSRQRVLRLRSSIFGIA